MSLTINRQRKFLRALERNGGFVTHAAKKAHTHRNTHLYWLEHDVLYREKFENLMETLAEKHLDDVEDVVLKKAKEGKPWAAILVMRSLGKHRGYTYGKSTEKKQFLPNYAQITVATEGERQVLMEVINHAQNMHKNEDQG